MKLSEWVRSIGGREEAARLLGVTDSAVHYWLKKGITPRVKTMRKIARLSKSQVTLREILEETKPDFFSVKPVRGRR